MENTLSQSVGSACFYRELGAALTWDFRQWDFEQWDFEQWDFRQWDFRQWDFKQWDFWHYLPLLQRRQ